eukprot:12393813-Prorocentrum_lima.AAC.1
MKRSSIAIAGPTVIAYNRPVSQLDNWSPKLLLQKKTTQPRTRLGHNKISAITTIATFTECYIGAQNSTRATSTLVACITETDAQHAVS